MIIQLLFHCLPIFRAWFPPPLVRGFSGCSCVTPWDLFFCFPLLVSAFSGTCCVFREVQGRRKGVCSNGWNYVARSYWQVLLEGLVAVSCLLLFCSGTQIQSPTFRFLFPVWICASISPICCLCDLSSQTYTFHTHTHTRTHTHSLHTHTHTSPQYFWAAPAIQPRGARTQPSRCYNERVSPTTTLRSALQM